MNIKTISIAAAIAVAATAISYPLLSAQSTNGTISLSGAVPHDVTDQSTAYPQVSLTQLSEFAWQEFIALNYPADPNHRGQAMANSSITDEGPRVWETYWHKVELFPFDQAPAMQSDGSPVVTGPPVYKYENFDFSMTYGGTGSATPNLWNNLDENNELNVDEIYAHVSIEGGKPSGFTNENRVLYEAKMNEAGAAYVLNRELYKTATRDSLAQATVNSLGQYGSTCSEAVTSIISLPCGVNSGGEGNIEIKAAWRKLTTTEMSSGDYYTNQVMRYEQVSNENKWFIDTYGLIGLHIIHKTQNFPSFVYATFEHNDNLSSGLGYVDEITQSNRGKGDQAGKKVFISDRDNPIPADVAAVNVTAQQTLSGSVWANYQLVGVQAYPIDYSDFMGSSYDPSVYYLANIVIESNEELQNFRGLKVADMPDAKNMYKAGSELNMGGCMGCHGVGQLNGSDFNFLIKNSPFTAPEIVGATGIISFRPINSFADVQNMFNDFVMLNGIQINSSPHGRFWSTLDYEMFTTGNVPGVGIKIVDCGNSENSAIIQILEGSYESFPEMPAGGPYFPEEQLTSFAGWVDKGCPQ